MFRRRSVGLSITALGACIGGGNISHCNSAPTKPKPLSVNGINEFNTVIVGGGTAGCTTAYLTAKWMEDANIPGKILSYTCNIPHATYVQCFCIIIYVCRHCVIIGQRSELQFYRWTKSSNASMVSTDYIILHYATHYTIHYTP